MNKPVDEQTALAASVMYKLDRCPSCGGSQLGIGFSDNDLTGLAWLPENLRHSDFTMCETCTLVFSAWRQKPEAANDYYKLFADLEHRAYAVYPPPERYQTKKAWHARRIVTELEAVDALKDGQNVLHIRSDCGSLGPAIREKYPNTSVQGLDYFDSNVRFANESGNLETGELKPDGITIVAERAFDVVVVNHMFTHSIDLASDLDACRRMLKPGGILYSYNENDFQESTRLRSPHFRLKPVNNYHKQLFSPMSLKRMFAAAGFDVLHAERRKCTISTALRQHPEVTMEPADKTELEEARVRLQGWIDQRKSLTGKILGFGPVKQSLKKFASDMPALPY